MGCTGSKTAQADKVASTTLLTEPSADSKETKPDAPVAEVSTTETASKQVAADAPAEDALVSESEALADANAAKADEKEDTKAEEVEATKEPGQGATEESNAQEQLVDGRSAWALQDEAVRIFKLADKDESGFIDMAELANLRNSEKFAEVMMGEKDENADGKLSLEEWLGYVKKIFDKKESTCKALLKLYEKQIGQNIGVKVEAPEERPVVAEVEEEIGQGEDGAAPVSVVAATPASGSQKGGCLNFCLATEAQTEIVVEN
jgi:hypothetical protein